MNRLFDRPRKIQWIARGSHNQPQEIFRLLLKRQISLKRCLLIHAVELYVSDYPDHLAPRRIPFWQPMSQAFSNRVFSGEEPRGERLVDDRDLGLFSRVGFRKHAAFQEPDSRRSEEILAHRRK